MTATLQWAKGAPRRTGVHAASTNRDCTIRRYWHGKMWSAPWFDGDCRLLAERAIRTMGESQVDVVEWLEGPHLPVLQPDEPLEYEPAR